MNKIKILKIYERGLSDLINYINEQECLVFEDEFSEKVSNIVLNDFIIIDEMNKLIESDVY